MRLVDRPVLRDTVEMSWTVSTRLGLLMKSWRREKTKVAWVD